VSRSRRTRIALALVGATGIAVVTAVYALADPAPPPQPRLTGKPLAATSSRTATFTYTDTQVVTFECSRDSSDYTACGGPATSGSKSYSGLSAGSHIFSVRARSGTLTSAPAVFVWVIDLTAPTTPVLSFDGLSANAFYRAAQNVLFFRSAPGGAFRVTAASTDPESAVARYTFSPLAANGFTASQSGGQVTYAFGLGATQPAAAPTVVATNGAGLDSAAASYLLRADTDAPTGGALRVNGVNATAGGSTSGSTTGTFAISRTDFVESPSATRAGLAASTLTREGAPLAATGCGLMGAPVTLTGAPSQTLGEGCYRYTLTGTDLVGNVAVLRTTVTVDGHPPVLTITFPRVGAVYNAAAWDTGCAGRLCGQATDPSGVASVELSVAQAATGRYWNGSGFAATSQAFVTAPVSSGTWSYALPASAFATDGAYVVSVRARDALGNATPAALYVTTAFTIDRAPPPAPTITGHPTDPTQQHDAAFAFSDTEAGTSFRCALDGAGQASCTSPLSLSALDPGSHRFCIQAVDAAGNTSAQTCFAWQIASLLDFSIAGSASTALYPGGPAVAVELVFTNPNSVPITVTAVTTAISATSAPGCAPTDFVVERQLTTSAVVPAGATASLIDLGVPRSAWPEVRMVDRGNQDPCQKARVSLSFTGSALG
jgi:hypothetical protein